jgi:dodecin
MGMFKMTAYIGLEIHERRVNMSVVKVIEILAESNESWEDAVKVAVKEASKSVSDIQAVYVKEMQAIVEGDQVVRYRVNAKISFKVKG